MRFPGGSIGELAVNGTVNDLAVAGARPLALTLVAGPRGGPRRRRAARRGRGDRARPRAAAGVEIVAGDTKVVERGHADGMYICTTGVGARRPARARCRPAALRPGDRILVSGLDRRARHGDHARPRRVRARRRRSSPTRARCGRRSTRCSTPPAPALRCLRDATRGGVASVLNELARASRRGDGRARGRRAGATRRSRAPPSCSASTRCTSPTRASSSRSSRPRRPTRRSPRCARCRAASRRPRSARCATEPPGMVLVETAFGGRRVMDQLVGDPLPRIC